MKKKIQCYRAFTTKLYRLIMLILVPFLAIALSGKIVAPEQYMVRICVVAELVLFVEIMADYWVFGGISSKESGLPEYLKTSSCGMALLKNAVQVHMSRQAVMLFIMTGVVTALSVLKTGLDGWNVNYLLTGMVAAALGYLYIVLGSLAARFFSALYAQMIVATAASILMGFSLYILMAGVWAALVIVCAAAAAASVASVKTIMKSGEESYYDKAD